MQRTNRSGPSDQTLRSLASRQWPVAAVLSVLFAAEGVSLTGGPGELSRWQLPVVAVVGLIAIAAPLAPITAAVTAAVLVATETVAAIALQTPGPLFLGGIALTEMIAVAAIAVTVVRYARARPAALTAAAVFLSVALASNLRPVFRMSGPPEDLRGLEIQPALVLALAITTGLYLRQRDRDHTRAIAASVTTARQVERLTLARELHDLVAHHVTGILVQVKAARRVADARPGAAADVLPDIEASGTEAMIAMRRLVHALRRADDTPIDTDHRADLAWGIEPSGDLAADLRRMTEHTSLPVVITVNGAAHPLPPEIAGSVLRIARESLTNVEKHARTPRAVTVVAQIRERIVTITIRDDGRRTNGSLGVGYGLIGMRERVQLLGGRLHAGPTSAGWEVHAELPIDAHRGAE